jgi:hypothetical protein
MRTSSDVRHASSSHAGTCTQFASSSHSHAVATASVLLLTIDGVIELLATMLREEEEEEKERRRLLLLD